MKWTSSGPKYISYAECLVPATVEGKTGAEDRVFFEGVNWWKPDEAAAASIVASIVNGSASKVSPAKRLIDEYTWDNAARKLLAAMDDLI